MTRPLRIEFNGAYYHVISRGQRRDPIFIDVRDRERFLELLEETCEKHGARVHAYVLMGNHYHLLLSTPAGNLVKAMKWLNTAYANGFKARHGLMGGILQGRYKAILIDGKACLAQVSAHIHLNPVRAGVARRPEGFAWSSYRFYQDRRVKPLWLETDEVLARFQGERARYRRFVEQWTAEPELDARAIYGVRGILGDAEFIKRALKAARARLSRPAAREMPAVKGLDIVGHEEVRRIIHAMSPDGREDLFEKRRGNVWRRLLIYGLKRHSDLGLGEIGRQLGMDYTAVGQSYCRFCRLAEERREVRVLKEKLDTAVRALRME